MDYRYADLAMRIFGTKNVVSALKPMCLIPCSLKDRGSDSTWHQMFERQEEFLCSHRYETLVEISPALMKESVYVQLKQVRGFYSFNKTAKPSRWRVTNATLYSQMALSDGSLCQRVLGLHVTGFCFALPRLTQ